MTDSTPVTAAWSVSVVEALERVLSWPLPQGTVETWALPPWLAKQARKALADVPNDIRQAASEQHEARMDGRLR